MIYLHLFLKAFEENKNTLLAGIDAIRSIISIFYFLQLQLLVN